ncbi:hypothetical protein ACHAWF_001572 [Thalassiosira exigua]
MSPKLRVLLMEMVEQPAAVDAESAKADAESQTAAEADAPKEETAKKDPPAKSPSSRPEEPAMEDKADAMTSEEAFVEKKVKSAVDAADSAAKKPPAEEDAPTGTVAPVREAEHSLLLDKDNAMAVSLPLRPPVYAATMRGHLPINTFAHNPQMAYNLFHDFVHVGKEERQANEDRAAQERREDRRERQANEDRAAQERREKDERDRRERQANEDRAAQERAKVMDLVVEQVGEKAEKGAKEGAREGVNLSMRKAAVPASAKLAARDVRVQASGGVDEDAPNDVGRRLSFGEEDEARADAPKLSRLPMGKPRADPPGFCAPPARPAPAKRTPAAKPSKEAPVPEEDYANMTVKKLKVVLRSKGLPVSGRKDDLIKRLKEGASQG